MSGQDIYQNIGAAFGIASVIWMMITQMFGTFTERALKRIVDRQREDYARLVERLEDVAQLVLRPRRGAR